MILKFSLLPSARPPLTTRAADCSPAAVRAAERFDKPRVGRQWAHRWTSFRSLRYRPVTAASNEATRTVAPRPWRLRVVPMVIIALPA